MTLRPTVLHYSYMHIHSSVCLLPAIAAALSAIFTSAQAQSPQLSLDWENGAHVLTLSGEPGRYNVESSDDLNSWTLLDTLDLGIEGTAKAEISTPSAAPLFLRASMSNPLQYVLVTSTGASFSPYISCTGTDSPDILWSWEGGGSSSSYPEATVRYAGSAPRNHMLEVRGPATLVELNFGFDASDGGEASPLARHPEQSISALSFPHPIRSLVSFGASHNSSLESLDFSGFENLEYIECYMATGLNDAKVRNLPKLKRVCFEACALTTLDLSGCPELGDIRAALNQYREIVFDEGTGAKLWHLCVRDNPQITQDFASFLTRCTAMEELFIWNDNQRGDFVAYSHVLTSLMAGNNHYTSATLGEQPNMYSCDLSHNALESFSFGGLPLLQHLYLSHNDFDAAALDAILAGLVEHAPELHHVDLSYNNEPPGEAGLASAQTLRLRGVTVLIDTPDENDGLYDIEGGDSAVTFLTQATSVTMSIETSSTPKSVIWHWGDGSVTNGSYSVTHEFSSTAIHVNYVEVIPADCVTRFGVASWQMYQGVTGVRYLDNFPNLEVLYLYTAACEELSLANCSKLRELHLAGLPVDSATCDQWFIDLDAAVPGPVSNAVFFFPSSARTSASDEAFQSLQSKGYTMEAY